MNVDITKPTLISLCTGYGGLELGIERAIGRKCFTLAASEIEAWAIENLLAKMEAGLLPPAPIWSDLRTFPARSFHGLVDILCGGYPCQDFSAAGKRSGFVGEKGKIWGYVRSIVRQCEPRICFFENVDGHVSLGLSTVLSDLEEDGYRTTWGVFSAAEVGAPHQRKRVFILAVRAGVGYDACGAGLQEHLGQPRTQSGAVGAYPGQDVTGIRDTWPSRPGERQHCWEPPRTANLRGLPDPEGELGGRLSCGTRAEQPESGSASGDGVGQADAERTGGALDRSGERVGWGEEPDASGPQELQSEAQPPLGRDTLGAPGRVDHAGLYESCDNRVEELRLLGNGVVPATAEKAWRTLWGRFFSLSLSLWKTPTSEDSADREFARNSRGAPRYEGANGRRSQDHHESDGADKGS